MKIRKRNGDLVDFEVDKIQTAIKKAFNDTNTEITEEIKKIGKYIKRKIEKDDSLANVESIQDLVEVELQKRGYYQEAKEYILYRDKRNKHRTLMAKFDKIVNDKKILAIIDEIPKEFEEERYPLENFYQKVEAFTGKTNITEKEILDSLIKASSELTDKNSPDWEFIAARFLMYKLDKEIDRNEEKYGIVDFKTKIKFLEKDGRYGSYILENYSSEEIDELEDYINKDYDKLLTYSGLDLLIKRYIIKTKEDEPLERVQEMFMGIAMHLAMNEENKIGFAKDVYDILASLKATMATPTMSNARKPHHQLSSCFIDTVDDSLEGIFDSVSRFAKVSKFGGGMGMYMGKVRANGSDIRGYKGAAGGVIRWIRIINDTAVAVDQLGTRQGSVAVYLDLWHKDTPEFLGLRTNNGDDRMKAHDVFPAICVPDLFWRLCRDDINATWYMFDPHEIEQKYGKALEDTYGEEWEEFYNKLVSDKEISKRTIQVKELVRLIIKSWAETGTPFVFNRDTVNKMNPNKHAGMIYSSNLCVTGDTQILTSKGYRKVIDLYNSQEDFDVIVDDRARTMNTDNKTVSVQKSTKMFKTKENTEIYKMTLSNGQELKATPYHKMYRLNEDKEVEKVELKDLAIKDKILIQNSEGYYGYNHNPELAYLMGVWAAEGTITRGRKKENNSAMLSLFGKKQEHKENIEELISVLLENRNDLVERQSVLNPKFKRYRDKSIIHSAPLYKLFKEFSYDLRDKVVVPNYIKQADKDTQIAYISGILSFDGCVTKTGCIELISTDTMFLRDIQNILLNMGIFSSIYKGKEAGKYEMPDGKGGLKLYKCNQTHKLTIARGMLPKIYKKFNLSSWQAKRITEIMGSDPEFYNIDRTYSTVKSIKVLEEKEDVYDVTVENGHSLIFNGIVTGNCSEICQNMIPAEVMEEKVTTKDGDTVIVKTDRPGDFVECNLASLTLGNLDVNNKEELEHTINTIVRALDNVIDLNYYPTPYAEVTNKRYRAIGLGTSGYHHMLVKNGIRWSDKEEHLEFVDRVYEDINYYTIKASMIIAKEKGPYELFEGSDWQTGDYFDLRNYNSDRWEELRKDVKKYGIRNSYLMAIAPTGSTSIISGTSAGVDPIMSRYYLEEKKGSIVPRVAPGLDNRTFWLYENAHNVDQNITVEATGIRQRHIDQSQSVNIYITTDYTMRQILNIYINAWENGVKSLYYVRGKSLEIEDCEVCSA